MSKIRRKAKVITAKYYSDAVKQLEEFLEGNMVYIVECLPERQGYYGFVVYY